MSTTQDVWTTDLPVTGTSMAGLANNTAVATDPVDIRSQGYQSLQIQVRFKTGAITTPDVAQVTIQYRGSVDNERFANRLTTGNTFNMSGLAASTSYIMLADIPRPSPFWRLLIINKTGAAFNSDSAEFEINYAGRKTVTEV